MTLSDFANFSTALSGIVVTASLIYLAIQTRQASKHTRALIQQGQSARNTSILIGLQRPESCVAWIEHNGVAPTPERVSERQYLLICAAAISALEDLYSQNSDGLLTAEQFGRNCQTFRGLLAEPGLRAYWNAMRQDTVRVAPKFGAFVESLCVGEATTFKNRV